MGVVIGRTRKFWKEVRYFEIIEPYSHNIVIDRPWIINLWTFFNRKCNRLYLDRIDFLFYWSVY